jgi:hypothetical protein
MTKIYHSFHNSGGQTMPRPESIKIPIPPEEALRRRYDDVALVEKDVGNSEVRFRIEDGTDPELAPDEQHAYVKTAREWAKVKPGVDERVARQEGRKNRLKEIVVEHPGLRGLFDLVRRRTVRIDTETDIKYSRTGLKEQLGDILYPTVVSETAVFKFEGVSPERARMILLAGYAALQMTEDDYQQAVTESVELEVREKRLYELIKEGKVDPEGIGDATMSFRIQSDEYTGSSVAASALRPAAATAEPAVLQPANGG